MRPCVRPSVRVSTLLSINISETGRPAITITFYMKHHLAGGNAALVFGADQIRWQHIASIGL